MATTPQNEITANTSTLATTFLEMSQLCLSSLERLSALNLNAMREALDEGMVTADRMSHSNEDPATMAQPKNIQPLLNRSMSYSQNVMEICASTQEEMMRLVNSRMSDFKMVSPMPFQQGWANAMDTFTRTAQQMASMGAETVASASRSTEQAAERVRERVSERPERHTGGRNRAA